MTTAVTKHVALRQSILPTQSCSAVLEGDPHAAEKFERLTRARVTGLDMKSDRSAGVAAAAIPSQQVQ